MQPNIKKKQKPAPPPAANASPLNPAKKRTRKINEIIRTAPESLQPLSNKKQKKTNTTTTTTMKSKSKKKKKDEESDSDVFEDAKEEPDEEEEEKEEEERGGKRKNQKQQTTKNKQRRPHSYVAGVFDPDIKKIRKRFLEQRNEERENQKQAHESLSPQEKKHLTSEAARFFLFQAQKTNNQPIQRTLYTSMMNEALKGKKIRNVASYILPLVQLSLLDNLGLELQEVERLVSQVEKSKSAAVATTSSKGSSSFVLRSALPVDARLKFVDSRLRTEKLAWRGIIATISSLINVNGGTIQEEALFKVFRQFGLPISFNGKENDQMRYHEDLECEVSKIIPTLVTKRVLLRDKIQVASGSGFTFQYELGEGAFAALSSEHTTKLIAEMMSAYDQDGMDTQQQNQFQTIEDDD
jgi:hypothetical protein